MILNKKKKQIDLKWLIKKGCASFYISGKITGAKNPKQQFKECEDELTNIFDGSPAIYEIINPFTVGEELEKVFEQNKKDIAYKDYMRADLKYLLDADAICLLSGWKNQKEQNLNTKLQKP